MIVSVKITREENAEYCGVHVGDTLRITEDDYIAGVVASEIGNSHLEACKAQAVAARTFAACKNWSLTDSSATDQAFRAKRIDDELYPNAIQAASETNGQILLYNGKPISAVYSACNGGRTVSAKARWGSERAYLPEQDDPWDNSTKRTGHGVGMSQRGAKYAASIGKTYKEILSFYYPGTEIKMAVKEGEKVPTAEQFVEKVKIPLAEGWGYIYGTWGKLWTKELQARMNKTTEEKYAKSRQYGSKWIGKMVTDCSGLVRWAANELGVKVAHHAWYLYTDYCKVKGKLVNGMRDDGQVILPGTLVFIKSNKEHIHHVGVYVGDNTCIEAKGVQYGVVTSPLSHWEFWGELKDITYGNKIQVLEVSGLMKATVNSNGKLNIRSNAGKQYPVLFQLTKGTVVEVLDHSESDWWQIRYNGRIGWAYSRYLVPDVEVEAPVPFEPEKTNTAELENVLQLMRASINALHDELDRLEEMVGKL